MPAESRFAAAAPVDWVQQIKATPFTVRVREDILRADGTRAVVTAEARFDGREYPVAGSPAADTIAYTREGRLTISGVARKKGRVTFNEVVHVSDDHGVLIHRIEIHGRDGHTATSTAVFKRQDDTPLGI